MQNRTQPQRRKKMFQLFEGSISTDSTFATTDATLTPALTIPLSPQTWNYFKGKITAYETTTYNENFSEEFEFSVYLADVMTTYPVFMDTVTVSSTYDPDTVPWLYSITLSETPDPDQIVISVTGEVDHDISWNITIKQEGQMLV